MDENRLPSFLEIKTHTLSSCRLDFSHSENFASRKPAFRGLTLHVLFANPSNFLRVQHVCAKSLWKMGLRIRHRSETRSKQRPTRSARDGHPHSCQDTIWYPRRASAQSNLHTITRRTTVSRQSWRPRIDALFSLQIYRL